MTDPVITDTNRFYREDDEWRRIHEASVREVSEMKDKEVIEYCELYLYDEIYELCQHTWRAFEPRNEIDGLLQDLMNIPRNLGDFLCHLNLYDKAREMVVEHMVDRRMCDAE